MTTTSVDWDQVRSDSRRTMSVGRSRVVELFGGYYEVGSEGSLVYTQSGETFLNCAGYGVFLIGARHPHVVEAVIDQIRRHPTTTRILGEPTIVEASVALAEVCPPGLEKVHFASSGTEANETAIKLARANGCTRLIATQGGFHGKTLGSLSLTGNAFYQNPFQPLLACEHVPFGDADAVEQALAARPDERAAVIVEPVQGEAGVRIAPDGWLQAVRAACDRHEALLVLDEVQTGLGRLGSWWGCSQAGVIPDILTVGKSLSGAVVPVSATVATPAVFRPFDRDPLLHTSTFSGAPIAMAAARAAIEVLREENVPQRAADLGARLLTDLQRLAEGSPGVREIRGRGLLIGIEMADPSLAGELMHGLLLERVLANHSLNDSRVVRLTPSALLSQHEEQWLLDAVERALP